MADDDTSIRIKVDTWRRLQERKDHPNKSFDDVIRELLDEADSGKQSPADFVLAD